MAVPDKVVQQRLINSVDRREDSRIENQGSWYSLQNFFTRQPGLMVKRPGSVVKAHGAVQGVATTNIVVPPIMLSASTANLSKGEVDLSLSASSLSSAVTVKASAAMVQSGFGGTGSMSVSKTGTRGLVPKASATLIPTISLPFKNLGSSDLRLTHPIQRVAGLFRAYFDGTVRFLVGAVNLEGAPDQLFYIDDGDNKIRLFNISTPDNLVGVSHATGADFYFQPIRSTDSTDITATSAGKGYWAIGTNGVNQPFTIKKLTGLATPSTYGVTAAPLNVCISAQAGNTGPSDASNPSAADVRLVGVRSLCIYNGSLCWGGFRTTDAQSSPTVTRYDHYICFSDPGQPYSLACTSNIISSIQIGDTDAEPVVAVANTATATDSEGIKTQLVAFTDKKVVIFDGLPPVSGNPLGVNFTSNIIGAVGCSAPRSIVATPYGVVFLGTDGIFYLLREGYPHPIGRGIQGIFRGMTIQQQRSISAVWDPEGFYKVSYPEIHASAGRNTWKGVLEIPEIAGSKGAHAEHVVPDRQFWADLRNLDDSQADMNCKWSGPHVGMVHSCMCVAYGQEDRQEIYAGSAIDGTIFQVARYDKVTDPTPGAANATTTTPIECVAISGLYDLGDAHVDKTVTAFTYGIGVDRATTVTASIIANSSSAGIGSQTDFVQAINPAGAVLDSTFILGTSSLSTGDDFTLITNRPPNRVRGATFRFLLYESPTAGARCYFSDLSFRAIVAQRRN